MVPALLAGVGEADLFSRTCAFRCLLRVLYEASDSAHPDCTTRVSGIGHVDSAQNAVTEARQDLIPERIVALVTDSAYRRTLSMPTVSSSSPTAQGRDL